MNNVVKLHEDEVSSSQIVIDDDLSLIDEGVYEAKIIDWETKKIFGKNRSLYVHFKICELGSPFNGTKVCAYYNIDKFIGKPGKRGSFKVSRKRKFTKEYEKILPATGHGPESKFGLSMELLTSKLLRVRVETVKKDYNKHDLGALSRYSKVAEMVNMVST